MSKITVEEGIVKYRPFMMNRLKLYMRHNYDLDYDEMYQAVCLDSLEYKSRWIKFEMAFTTWINYFCRKQAYMNSYRIRMNSKRNTSDAVLAHSECQDSKNHYDVADIIKKLPYPHVVVDTIGGMTLSDMAKKYKVNDRTISAWKTINKEYYNAFAKEVRES